MASIFKQIIPRFNISSKINIIVNKPIYNSYEQLRMFSSSSNNDIKFVPVYHLSAIRYISVVNSLKNYQVIATGGAIPVTGMLEYLSVFPHNTTIAIACMGVSLGLSLSIGSYLLKDIVGIMYISEDTKDIKISSLNFWGKRIDTVFPVDDFVPLSDLPSVPTDRFFTTIRRYSTKDKYKFFLTRGKILDSDKLLKICGKLNVR